MRSLRIVALLVAKLLVCIVLFGCGMFALAINEPLCAVLFIVGCCVLLSEWNP